MSERGGVRTRGGGAYGAVKGGGTLLQRSLESLLNVSPSTYLD